MKPEVIERLLQINREFYTRFASSFSLTRSASTRDLEPILPYINRGARVLDIGCGNGRAGSLLARERSGIRYLGIDASAALIQIACISHAAPARSDSHFEFVVDDVTDPEWPQIGRLPAGNRPPFDSVLLLAMLHHVPSWELRARILRRAASMLEVGGYAIVSSWQFLENRRMRRKMADWSAIGIDASDLEPGDALLTWKRDGLGMRYCHWIGEDEWHGLALQAGLKIVEAFRAGGRERDLSLYAILCAA